MGFMIDDKDLEIARLKRQVEAASARPAAKGISAGAVVLWLAGIAIAVLVLMVVWGSQLPDGWRFEQECRAVAQGEAAKTCMADLEATFVGRDEHRFRKNAAEQWAADRRATEAGR